MKIKEYKFCFEPNSFIGKDLVNLLNESVTNLSFVPYQFEAGSLNIYDKTELTNEAIENLGNIGGKLNVRFFSLEDDCQFSICNTANRLTCQSLSWQLPEYVQLNNETILKFIRTNGFIVGYLFDYDFARWQSEIYPSNYKVFNRPLNKAKLFWNDFFNEEQIDIRQNYGRIALVKGMWLTASPLMWLGSKYFDYVPKEKLLDYPSAMEMEVIDNRIIRIKLFEEIFSSHDPENYLQLKKFREWVDMDTLETKFK